MAEKLEFISHICKIAEIAEQAGGINDLFHDFAGPHLDYISALLQMTKMESALFAVLANLYDGNASNIDAIAKALNCRPLEVMQYMDQFEVLEQKGLIHIFRETSEYRSGGDQFSLGLRGDVADDLLKGNYQRVLPPRNLSINDFFIHLERLFEERIQKCVSYQNTLRRMTVLLQGNEHLKFVKKIKELSLNEEDTLVLFRFFHYTVTLNQPAMTFFHLEGLYDHGSDFGRTRRQLINGDYVLITKGLIENSCKNCFGDTETFQLTESAREEFLVELNQGLHLMPVRGLKKAAEITRKNLFYPERTQRAIDELGQLLQAAIFRIFKNACPKMVCGQDLPVYFPADREPVKPKRHTKLPA
jgi:hypothetical protein